MDRNPLKDYLAAIEASLKRGDATEHTHRPALKAMLEAVAGDPAVRAVNEPRRIACGAPDYVIARGTVPLGYVEAKDVGANLNEVERSEQLMRYRDSLGNLILTDYLEFRWYLGGDLKLKASLPRPGRDGRIRWNDTAASEVRQLLDQFLAADIPLAASPAELARRMAALARLIRTLIERTFSGEGEAGELHGQLEAFRKVLIDSLTPAQFADMYAQTLCYGLFAARCNAPAAGFTRQSAATALPRTNPFLRRMFNSIAGPDLDDRIAWAVDQLAELLARADIASILETFGQRTRQEDPVVHFYETFLAAYDPAMREARGVYYTPEPVVNWIVRSVEHLLLREFKLTDGLAHADKVKLKRPKPGGGMESFETHRLQILDPATGTGTFLYAVIQRIRAHFEGNAGAWPGYVAEHLLPRLFGFELLMAPYAVAHMKLGLELEQSGYDFASDQRLGVYLTNSLEEAHELTGMPLFTQWLAEESRAAGLVKREAPVMVVLGNPPYSGHSANTGAWIAGLLRGHDALTGQKTGNYFACDGKPLGERNPKWLNDDYVKFIRFAQWRIEQTGHGILAFVTNHGYLDNPTFRGMRQSLMQSFDALYLLDLHGNSKKKERAPDGGKDENVFDIQQGVAIGIFVRHPGKADAPRRARVFHADLYGTRALKYASLDAGDLDSTAWREIKPASAAYLFVPEDGALRAEYEQGWKITDAMPVHSLGIATARDALTVHFSEDDAWKTVMRFVALPVEEARTEFSLGPDARDWKVAFAQADLKAAGPTQGRIAPMLYRPFDIRWTYYTGKSRGFHCMPRNEVMREMLRSNLALSTTRAVEIGRDFEHVMVSQHLTTLHTTSIKEVNYHLPLWLYPSEAADLLDASAREKRPNLAPAFLADLTAKLGQALNPETILAYIYAVLYAPSYRTRYAEFLKRDFPRVPLPRDAGQFDALAALGQELIELHTMQRALPAITRYPVAGSNHVDKVRWAPATNDALGRVYINSEQYFDGVPAAVWDTHIGGYRVAEKWLKDRKGRALSYDDLTHYQNVVAALARTLKLQASIDGVIAPAGGRPIS